MAISSSMSGGGRSRRWRWGFTAAIDVPPFEAKAGDRVELDLACIWTVRDGKLVEYHDYG